ncbi:MAG: UDP-N-acetylmuramate dehydrogenase [Bacillota bacterium]|jgi:UDP-N-acetylmuramate dehydrogenase|nr:UDP-N-acetylmuramate dehydrogenase [Bacillota bacterium]HOB41801.1 UDP-N-acetylmuramate dehydrogenase [Bacillota bacterium]HOK70537.1 UDP-N-acetylmuramate dehydrogenase [Bacillota bacterium]HOL50906.1 UDP-N-acetylmuramate dehydrogenase [Bacillota bacterium]HOO29484.1 UDP-N-acetylmuramate dehydrogenase [Bacillota bacterium]
MTSMVTDEQARQLAKSFNGRIALNEPMKKYTSFQIGGPADMLVQPRDLQSLSVVLRWAWNEGLPLFVLGNGTNLLVADEGIRGVVVRIGPGLDSVSFDGERVRAMAGVSMPALARACAERGLAGLEWAVGIPGSLGGAMAMNAGAYSHTVGDFTREVTTMLLDGSISVKSCEEMQFAQRSSRLSHGDLIACEAVLVLEPGDPESIRCQMSEYMEDRRIKQPLHLPSAGCVFQNPSGRGAGRYIDGAGLKGLRVGGAEISRVHANFIVNVGDATARDVLILMNVARRTVYEKFGVELVPEIRVVGG